MHAFKSEEGVLGSSSGESIIASVIIKETAKNLAYLSSRLASVLQSNPSVFTAIGSLISKITTRWGTQSRYVINML